MTTQLTIEDPILPGNNPPPIYALALADAWESFQEGVDVDVTTLLSSAQLDPARLRCPSCALHYKILDGPILLMTKFLHNNLDKTHCDIGGYYCQANKAVLDNLVGLQISWWNLHFATRTGLASLQCLLTGSSLGKQTYRVDEWRATLFSRAVEGDLLLNFQSFLSISKDLNIFEAP